MHDATVSTQNTNTNDAANGAISCVFYDTQINGMCQCVIPLCLCCLCAHVVADGYTPVRQHGSAVYVGMVVVVCIP